MSNVRFPMYCNPYPILFSFEKEVSFTLKKVKTINIPEIPSNRNLMVFHSGKLISFRNIFVPKNRIRTVVIK